MDTSYEVTEIAPGTFSVKWIGKNRVPRFKLNGILITYTRHSIVYTEGGQEIGTYERKRDHSGPNGDENEMLIKLWS
jgi:hypothetical protein